MHDPLAGIPWPLVTDRLSIRRVTPDDAAATWEYRRLAEVGAYIGWFAQSEDEYRELFVAEERLATVLAIELDGRVIGDVIVHIEDAYGQREVRDEARGRQAEIGWSLHPDLGGRGYATEAVRAVIDACFETLGLHRVHADCFAENEPSWRMMERLGMRREAHLRGADLHRTGEWKDAYSYALLADEWPEEAARRAAERAEARPVDPLTRVSWPLTTERLSIRRVRESDDAETWRYRRLPEVGEHIGWWSADRDEYLARQAKPDRRGMMLTIELPSSDGGDATIIGDIMVKMTDGWAQHPLGPQAVGTEAELGWNIDPAYGGRGYATEAVRAVMAACFEQMGLRRLHAGCFADNEPSWRLMERVGMRREEHSRATGLHRSGVWMDGMNYAILADEWGAQSGN